MQIKHFLYKNNNICVFVFRSVESRSASNPPEFVLEECMKLITGNDATVSLKTFLGDWAFNLPTSLKINICFPFYVFWQSSFENSIMIKFGFRAVDKHHSASFRARSQLL